MPALGHIYGEGWKGNGELCSPTIINPLNEHNQPRQHMWYTIPHLWVKVTTYVVYYTTYVVYYTTNVYSPEIPILLNSKQLNVLHQVKVSMQRTITFTIVKTFLWYLTLQLL